MKRFAILLPALMVAGCHHAASVSADNASVSDVAAKVDAAGGGPSKMAPGHYDMTTTVTKVEIPAMPAAAQQMRDSMGKGATSAICITPEQAAKPAASMFAGQQAKNCTYDHFSMSTGSIDAKMSCKGPSGTAVSTMKGSFAADGFHMDVTSETKAPPPMGDMTMAMTIEAKRAGACTGTEAR